MVIREAGLMFRGFTVCNGKFHQTGAGEIDADLRSGLLTAMLNFAETAFTSEPIEYFEGKKFVIAFTQDECLADDSRQPEPLIGFAILDKRKKLDKYIKKVLIPLLKKVINKFKTEFEGKNLSEISQFRGFHVEIEKIFGMESKKIDQRLTGLFTQKL